MESNIVHFCTFLVFSSRSLQRAPLLYCDTCSILHHFCLSACGNSKLRMYTEFVCTLIKQLDLKMLQLNAFQN